MNFSPVDVLSEYMLKPGCYEIEHELLLFCLNLTTAEEKCSTMVLMCWIGLVFWASKLDRVYLLESCYS